MKLKPARWEADDRAAGECDVLGSLANAIHSFLHVTTALGEHLLADPVNFFNDPVFGHGCGSPDVAILRHFRCGGKEFE